MAAVSKFMFDTAFDSDAASARAGAPASSKILLTKDELEAAKAKAFADGQVAGQTRAAAETAALLASAAQALAAQCTALLQQADRRHQERLRDAVAIAVASVQRLLPGLVERDGTAEIETLFRACVTRLHDEPRILVRIGDALLDPLRERLENIAAASGFNGRLVLLADPSLGAGDARIEWADGGVDRAPASVQAEIAAVIDRFLAKSADT